MTQPFPSTAEIVIIGGGVIGTSIAYNLVKQGARDVLLLEKTLLTEGATWHAAGLVGQFRSQQNLMQMMSDSVQIFDQLEADTGQNPSWNKVGSMRIAASKDRWDELLKSHSAAQAVGFEMNMLTPQEALDLYPLMEVDDLIGAAFIPEDGHIDPNSLTQAYARGIRKYGGRIIEGVMVKDLIRVGRRISHVVTDHGTIEAGMVVNAAGLWARQVGWMAGVDIPAGVVQHQYLVTEKTRKIPNDLPAFRDPDGGYYAKPEPGALAIGGWEKSAVKVNPKEGFPWDRARHLFDADMERIEEFLEPALHRLPILGELGVRMVVNGPIPISPDGEPIMGLLPGLDNVFAACAFTSGIAASGGAGKAAANWILHGDAGLDLWAFDIRRFGALQAGADFLHDRAVESYAKYYDIHWPGEELETARGVRLSPLYHTLKSQGAVFGSKFGWERANWFAHGEIAPEDVPGFDRPGQAETVGREHKAVREGVALIDMSSFTKFEISGTDAVAFLQYLAVANIDKPVGGATYTQLCNTRGGIEADVTIIRRSKTDFWLITGSALGVRDKDWMERVLAIFSAKHRKNRASNGEQWVQSRATTQIDVQIRDITSAYGVINVAGPLARDVLAKIADSDMSHDAFPFMTSRDIRIGYAPAVAYRVTYVGELGWELYIPTEYMQYTYDIIQNSGAEFGIINVGYRAIDSLRIEKRFLAWGVDITPDHTPLEAGLGFVIDWNKGDFLGRDALAKQKREGLTKRLVCLALEAPLAVFGGEAILARGKVVGQTTSGNFGYTVGKSLVLGYLSVEAIAAGDFAVTAMGKTSAATLIKSAAYDPERKKLLC